MTTAKARDTASHPSQKSHFSLTRSILLIWTLMLAACAQKNTTITKPSAINTAQARITNEKTIDTRNSGRFYQQNAVIGEAFEHAFFPSDKLIARVWDQMREEDKGNKYFVVFAARGDTPGNRSEFGHAFVILAKEDQSTKQSSYQALGLYRVDEGKSERVRALFGKVPGRIVDEALDPRLSQQKNSTPYLTDKLIVQVDAYDYHSALKVVRQWETIKDYNGIGKKILGKNCIDFIEALGNAIGLQMPERSLSKLNNFTPQNYVRALVNSAGKPSHLAYENGVKYDGPVCHGGLWGKGSMSYPNGLNFTGNFSGGEPAQGKFTLPNEVTWEGNFTGGTLNGYGVLTAPDGTKYEGNYRNGHMSGHGVCSYPGGSSYDGDFASDLPDGMGSFRRRDGKTYSGRFSHGLPAPGSASENATNDRNGRDAFDGRPNSPGTKSDSPSVTPDIPKEPNIKEPFFSDRVIP